MTISKAVFQISASVSGQQAVKELERNVKSVSTAGDSLKKSMVSAAGALRVFAASAVVAGLTAMVKNSIDLADSLNDLSQRTGVAVETLAKYKVQADNSGSSIEELARGIGKLNRALIDAQNGGGDAAAAFKALGVEIKDKVTGQLRPTEAILEDVAEQFNRFEDGAGKSAVAVALFGKAGENLIPFLNLGKQGVKEFALEIDQNLAAKADAVNDKLGVMSATFQNFGLRLTAQVLPTLLDLSESFEDGGVAAQVLVEAVKTIQVAFVGLVSAVKIVQTTVGTAFAIMIEKAKSFGNVLYAIGSFDFGAVNAEMEASVKRQNAILDEAGSQYAQIAKDAEDSVKAIENADKTIKAIGGATGVGAANNNNPAAGTVAGKPQLVFNPPSARNTGGGGGGGKSEADKLADAYKRASDAAQEWIATQREEVTTLQMESDYIGKTSIEVEKLKDARKFDLEVAQKSKDLSASAREAFLAEAEAVKTQRQEIMQLNYERSRTFEAGAQSFLTKYAEDATNAAEQTQRAFETAFKGAEDAIVEFATTGKANFSDFANSIIKELIRISVQQTILGPLANSVSGFFSNGFGAFRASVRGFMNPGLFGPGFANGGVMTSRGALPLNRYATGGIANSPQLALFGEGRKPEAYVPLPDGRRIPVAMQGSGGTNVVVNVNVEGGTTTEKSSNQQGSELGKLVAGVVKSTLINEKRPGGLLAA